MSMNWNQFLSGFQTGQQIGNDLGSQYALRQLQDEQVTSNPATPATGTAKAMTLPHAGEVMPPAAPPLPARTGGPPPPSAGMAPPAPPAGAAGVMQQPAAPPAAGPAAPQPDMKFKYQFLGQSYDQEPTELELDQARGNARANIYERFGQPAMAIAARAKADGLGATAEQTKFRKLQMRDLQRQEDRAIKALGVDDLMQRAYNGDNAAQREVFKKYPRTTIPGIGETRIITNEDGSVKVSIKGLDGKTKVTPYKSIGAMPPEVLSGLLQGAAPALYGELGGEYATAARRDQLTMEQHGLAQQGQALQQQKFTENVRQFDDKFTQSKQQIVQAQKNWSAAMGMDIFRFNEQVSMNDLKRKETMQRMSERAEKIKTMRNPPEQFWHARLKILREPWNSSAPEIAMAMGLDILDDQTLPLINEWKDTTWDDHLRKQVDAGHATE